jgi:hypothetical protein
VVELKRWRRSIAMLATSLVAATMLAAHAVIEQLRVPRRMTAIIGARAWSTRRRNCVCRWNSTSTSRG